MQKIIKKYRRQFYGIRFHVMQTICLGLYEDYEPWLIEQFENCTAHLTKKEYLTLFSLPDPFPDGHTEAMTFYDWLFLYQSTIDEKRGWLVAGGVAIPQRIEFSDDSRLKSCLTNKVCRLLVVYNDSLEGAFHAILNKAIQERHELLNEARREQGLPEQTLEFDSEEI